MKIIISIIAFAALTLASDTDLQKVLKDGNDHFTSQMFQEVVKSNPETSVILSAFSVLTPLAQLALAAVGESHDELLKGIGFSNDNVTKEIFTHINRELKSVKGVDLRMANKIYIADGYELNDQFASVSKDVFNSEVQNLNFVANMEAADTINSWVEDHTNKRIKNLVDPTSLDGTTRSVLVNAIYFKGIWKDKFVDDLTQNRPFHVNKDNTIQVPTMYRQGDYKYGESSELDAKLIELPYEGEESSLLIVLPNKVDGIHALVEKLKDVKGLERAQGNMYTTEVDLYLPKFKIETTTNLKEVLQNMNIKKIFLPGQARLVNLLKGTNDMFISDAIQKAFIEVNEEGAEAAAANAFTSVVDNIDIHIPLKFKADRPFYYVLRHKAISLFNGVLYQPVI